MTPKKKPKRRSRITPISTRKLTKIFEKCGFHVAGQSGSHIVMRKPGHRWNLSFPIHSGRQVQPPLILKNIKRAGLTREEYFKLLDKI